MVKVWELFAIFAGESKWREADVASLVSDVVSIPLLIDRKSSVFKKNLRCIRTKKM